jgi:hypothetical protein
MLSYFFKNEWFYWYSGYKKIAIIGWVVKILIMMLFFLISAGEFGIVLAIILGFLNDIVLIGIIVLMIFLSIFGFGIPSFLYDALFSLIMGVIVSWIIARLVISYIAFKKEI